MNYKLLAFILSITLIGCTANQNTNNSERKNNIQNKNTVFQLTSEMKSIVYTTASETELRLTETGTLKFEPAKQATEGEISIFVNPNKSFQTFLGIGSSITDASAEVFAQLPKEKQEELLTAFYDIEKGIGYSLCRTPIHSCDFSSGNFTYIEEGDKELKTFSIERDKKYKIPLIKKATEAAGGELMLYASPWSPPAFMKTNKNMLQGGSLLPEYYDAGNLLHKIHQSL